MEQKITTQELDAKLHEEYPLYFLEMHEGEEKFIRTKNSKGLIPKRRILETGNQWGKGQPSWVEIPTTRGMVELGGLRPGDMVFTQDGSPVKLTGIFHKGERQCYRFFFSDGSITDTDGDHLWAVYLPSNRFKKEYSKYGKYRIMSTEELIKYREKHDRYGQHISIPICKPVQFPTQKQSIDPYVMGALLGDGSFSGTTILTTSDSEILGFFNKAGYETKKINSKYGYSIREKGYKPQRDEDNGQFLSGGMPEKLRDLGLQGKRSWEKSIPYEYLIGSAQQRIALLQGLMDTDGSIDSNKRSMEITTTSRQLSKDIKFLVQSLGGTVFVKERITYCHYGGERVAGKSGFRIKVKVPFCPFRLSRKANKYRIKTTTYNRIIRDIKKADREKCVCIAVDHPSGLYITEEFIVTHNSLLGFAEDIAHMIGYRPWLHEDDPDFKIDIPIPNKGLIGCETMEHSVVEIVLPYLRWLIPKNCYSGMHFDDICTRNSRGQVTQITIPEDGRGGKCGSTVFIRSYDQNAKTYEGPQYFWIHWDEPPPQRIFNAAERGKMRTDAPSWFTMTPLREAYIHDKFSSRADFDEEILVIRGAIWENCRDWCFKCDLTVEKNKIERKVKNCPQCNRILGFLPKGGIEEYLKTLDAEERETRELGVWKHLSGLVYKELDRDLHQYDDFPIPLHWMKIESIDPHDAVPTKVIFGAVSPEEIEIGGQIRNRIYWYTYLSIKGDFDSITRAIKTKRAEYGYEKPAFVMIDEKYGKREHPGTKCWKEELEDRGIRNIRTSDSSPGAVNRGHKKVREYLKLHHSDLTRKTAAGMLFAKEGCKGDGGPWHQMSQYQWKEGTEKPEEKHKDFPDCIRYAAVETPIYRGPEQEALMYEIISKRKEEAYRTRRRDGATAGA